VISASVALGAARSSRSTLSCLLLMMSCKPLSPQIALAGGDCNRRFALRD
jgi:hypothetical protein